MSGWSNINVESPWVSMTDSREAVGRRLEELTGASSRNAVNIRPRRMGFMLYIWEGKGNELISAQQD